MNIWGSKTLRRLALPMAVVSLGAALTAGWGQSLASSGTAASASDPNAIDPEVAVQSVVFVLVPKGNDNFRPENACGGSPALTTSTGAPNPHPFGTGLGLLKNLSIGPTRCTLAIFTPTIHQGEDLTYSSTPCPVTTATPVTAPNQSLKFVGLRNPNNLKACTAGVFLSATGTSPTTPDVRNPDLTPAQSAAGKVALHDWAGSSCKPGLCRLIATLVQQEGDFNAPGLCSAAFYLTGPCTVAVVTTSSVNGSTPAPATIAATPPVVHATPGGAALNFSDGKCPVSTSLSNRGDVQEGCTNLPFKPADMSFTLPPAAQPPFEVLLPCTTPPNTPAGCGPAKHSTEIAMQSLTLVVAPVNQFEFDPANACAIPGDTLSSLVVTRCTAAVLRTPVGFTGGTVNYPTSRCKLDLSAEFAGCFAQPFSPSKGTAAIRNLPPVVCRAPIPAIPPAAPAVLPAVACNIFVTLTHDDGDFNSENPCGSLLSGITSACMLASFNTDGRQQGDSMTVNGTTPVCPAGNGANAVADADVHDTCVSADSSIVAPFTAGSLANLLFLGTPPSMTVVIPEDRIV